MGHVESDTKNPSMVREDGSPKSRPGKDVPKISAQGRVKFRSQRKDSYVDYRRLDALFEALGFYLEREFYFERVDPGAQLEKNRPDQIVYANKQIGDNYSLFTARAFIRNSHFTHERVFSLNRRYEYIKWGSLQVKAQRIVCIDMMDDQTRTRRSSFRGLSQSSEKSNTSNTTLGKGLPCVLPL